MKATNKVKFPKCKNETINQVMQFMHERYGTSSFDVVWELSLASWELRTPAGFRFGLPLLSVCRYEPTVIVFNAHSIYKTCIDTKNENWKDLLKNELDRVFL